MLRREELLTVTALAAVVGLAASVVPTGALVAWFTLIVTANFLHRKSRSVSRCCSFGALGAVLVAVTPFALLGALGVLAVTARRVA